MSSSPTAEEFATRIPAYIDHSHMVKGSQAKRDAIRNNRRRGTLLAMFRRDFPEAYAEYMEERSAALKAPESMQELVDAAEMGVPKVYKRGGDKNPKTSDAEKLRIAKQADEILPSTFGGTVKRSLYEQAFGHGNIKADSSGDDAFVQGLVSGCSEIRGDDVVALTRLLLWKVLLGRLTAKTTPSRYKTIVWARADGKKPTKSHQDDPDRYSYGGARFLVGPARPAARPVSPDEVMRLPDGRQVYTRDQKRWRYYAPGESQNGKFVSRADAQLIKDSLA